ncbi:Rv2175c family DNA-binding protein [Williamsia sp. CHRR-6]|uniref:Rv2175c family DNA-binding protein n=1 Tax=Williamsia sp. CHRR-6 TaxID=2835871 RepID=UPI001BDA3DFB|nr:Rv2175c family DNA-binding protein [Williamsia sp. CHRR-6]MBT0565283.1 DNA-binding protein [Williamsia sp. CHRR-6]
MVSLPMSPDDLLPSDEAVLEIAEVARRLGVSAGKVRNLIAEHHLLAVNRDGTPMIPEVFLDGSEVAKHLTGLIDVLIDGGFDRNSAMRWLFTAQDDIGEYPARALHSHAAREMIRRAQALAL